LVEQWRKLTAGLSASVEMTVMRWCLEWSCTEEAIGLSAASSKGVPQRREPSMRMSTMRRALVSQPGWVSVWKMPMMARMRSSGWVEGRRSPLAMAAWMRPRNVPWTVVREPAMRRVEPPGTVSSAGRMRSLVAT
jgi:hypothetical protein